MSNVGHWRALSIALRAGAPETTCPTIYEPARPAKLQIGGVCASGKHQMLAQSDIYILTDTARDRRLFRCAPCLHESMRPAHQRWNAQQRADRLEERARLKRLRPCLACDRTYLPQGPGRVFCESCSHELNGITAAVAARFALRAA